MSQTLKSRYPNIPPVPFIAKQNGTFQALPNQKYETLKKSVDGNIEYIFAFTRVPLDLYDLLGRKDILVVCNEEGLYRDDFTLNKFITDTCTYRGIPPKIMGDVVIVEDKEE